MDWGDLILRLVRALGALVAAAAGIAALLTDGAFKKRDTPSNGWLKDFPIARYRLTPWGSILLAIILLASFMQFVGDWIKDSLDAKTLERTSENIRHDINATVTKSTDVSRQAIVDVVKTTSSQQIAAASTAIGEAAREQLGASAAINGQTRQINHATEQIAVNIWREQHPFGKTTCFVQFRLDLAGTKQSAELRHWLARVIDRSAQLRSGSKLPTIPANVVEHHPGGPAVLIVAASDNTDAGSNIDLVPNASEQPVDDAFFNPTYFLLVSRSTHPGAQLVVPSIVFKAKYNYVDVIFNDTASVPIYIIGEAQGDGDYNPEAGQVTNWLDLYGSQFTLRLVLRGAQQPDFLAQFRYDTFTFETSDAHWQATARIYPDNPSPQIVNDRPGSLTVAGADWNVLGTVPSDYPGERPTEFGKVDSRH